MEPEEAFGRALRSARKRAGLTQEQLALEASVQRNYISLLERGLNSPSLKMLFKLSAALGVTPTHLIERTEAEL